MEDKLNNEEAKLNNIESDKDVLKTYFLDYMGMYFFYEEDGFVQNVDDGEFILENLRKSNRFDYKMASYTFTKFGNISKGITKRNVKLEIMKDDINVKLNDEITHLDLRYKMEVKKLEDHLRVATRISEKEINVSVLLYINNKDAEECIEDLAEVKKY